MKDSTTCSYLVKVVGKYVGLAEEPERRYSLDCNRTFWKAVLEESGWGYELRSIDWP
jgi:hypothetical protein